MTFFDRLPSEINSFITKIKFIGERATHNKKFSLVMKELIEISDLSDISITKRLSRAITSLSKVKNFEFSNDRTSYDDIYWPTMYKGKWCRKYFYLYYTDEIDFETGYIYGAMVKSWTIRDLDIDILPCRPDIWSK